MARLATHKAVAMILAGGQGSRLAVLSERRAKPAVPFGGQYRLIDFTLSNAMHSNLPYAGILTQYRPFSLMDHLAQTGAWGYSGRGRVAAVLPPYVGESDASWYEGTADAIYQNLSFINRFDCDTVIVLSGDHVYHMDYQKLIEFHLANDADLTIACQPVPWEDTSRFGVMKPDANGRIVDFQEKPKSDPISNLASLGIYAFRRSALEERLIADADDKNSSHDFGHNVIPGMIREARVFCYEFTDYWRDVGTLHSYWEANLDALDPGSGLDLRSWDVRTNIAPWLAVSHRPLRTSGKGRIRNSLVSKGCLIEGSVENSVLSPGVCVREGATVTNSVILNGCIIGQGSVVNETIIDKHAIVGRDVRIGEGELSPNKCHPTLLDSGLTLIGREARLPDNLRVGRNCLIRSRARESDFASNDLLSGLCV